MDDFNNHVNGKRRTRRSAEQWATLIEQQRRSELSMAAFCRAQGLCEKSFYRWRRRLETSPRAASAGSPFVRLGVSNHAGASTNGSAIVVRFIDGVELHAGAERLGELVTLLRGGAAEGGGR